MRKSLLLVVLAAALGLVLASSAPPASAATVGPPEISWQMLGSSMVRFQLHFHNDDPLETTGSVSGQMFSQEFGVFVPHYGLIGDFNVPPMGPESFFDVFFDVPLSDLPPEPGTEPRLGVSAAQDEPCPPPMWVGNVDVIWAGDGGAGQVNQHYGTVGVCPGGPASCLHVVTGCAGNVTWAVRNVCPGWSVALYNEDWSAAPALLPPGWSGHICVSAGANIPVGAICCFSVDFTCAGVTATVNVCAQACDCPTPTMRETWGRIKTIYR